MAITNLTAENFDTEVLKSEKVVLVDFFATWCGPCMMMAPFIDEIADENEKVKVCKVDVDIEQELASNFDIFSIPTLLVFKNGNLAATQVGALPKEDILKLLDI